MEHPVGRFQAVLSYKFRTRQDTSFSRYDFITFYAAVLLKCDVVEDSLALL